ncbi:MAG: hypothetical protein ABEH43_06305, partial [Flavobacteriales bacterium]
GNDRDRSVPAIRADPSDPCSSAFYLPRILSFGRFFVEGEKDQGCPSLAEISNAGKRTAANAANADGRGLVDSSHDKPPLSGFH